MTNSQDLSARLLELKEEGENTFLAGAQYRVLRALLQIAKDHKNLTIDRKVVYSILHPSYTAEVQFPVFFKGTTYMCLGWRAWFDDGKPYVSGHIAKGGIRYLGVEGAGDDIRLIRDEEAARKLALDDVFALGLEMLAKNSGVYFDRLLRKSGLAKQYKAMKDLRVRGGSKGVIIGPRSSHLPDHNEFVKKALEGFGYCLGLKGVVGWDRDVPAGDIATTGTVNGSSVLDGFVDGYTNAVKDLKLSMPRRLILGVTTGKTADKKYRGNKARATAAGFGTVEALKAWVKDKKMKLADLRVVFDGSGNVALGGAKSLVSQGVTVVGLTDSRTVLFCERGFTAHDLTEISDVKVRRQSLADWAKSKKDIATLQSKGKLWKQSRMNVLFLSSAERIINKTNVHELPAGILIVDGANGPVTPTAEEVLSKKNIDHLTGSFANSGGVTGSLIEWAANIAGIDIPKARAEEVISLDIRLSFQEMKNLVNDGVVDSLADAFYYLAMKRVVEERKT